MGFACLVRHPRIAFVGPVKSFLCERRRGQAHAYGSPNNGTNLLRKKLKLKIKMGDINENRPVKM